MGTFLCQGETDRMTGGPEASLCKADIIIRTVRCLCCSANFTTTKHQLLIELYLRIWQNFGSKNVKRLGFKTTQFLVTFGCTKIQYRVSLIPVVLLVHVMSNTLAGRLIEDPCTDLTCTIPVRIYGDGAEAQRISFISQFTLLAYFL